MVKSKVVLKNTFCLKVYQQYVANGSNIDSSLVLYSMTNNIISY
jgi:hypothetical protein